MGRSNEKGQERLKLALRGKRVDQVRRMWQGQRVFFVTPIGSGVGSVQEVTDYGDVVIECERCCGEFPLVVAFDVECVDEYLSVAE